MSDPYLYPLWKKVLVGAAILTATPVLLVWLIADMIINAIRYDEWN